MRDQLNTIRALFVGLHPVPKAAAGPILMAILRLLETMVSEIEKKGRNGNG